jgi:hypothetical protein
MGETCSENKEGVNQKLHKILECSIEYGLARIGNPFAMVKLWRILRAEA